MINKQFTISKKINKIITSLIAVFLLLTSFYLLANSYWIVGPFIIWNLVLAFVPLALVLVVNYLFNHNKVLIAWILILFWMLFFPNAPYMMTDFMHIKTSIFFSGISGYNHNPLVWLELASLVLGVITGCLAGYLSLYIMIQVLNKRISKSLVNIFVCLSTLLAGFAIFIGRFLRLNSWDLITNPLIIIENLTPYLNLNTVILSLIFSVLIYISYYVFHLLIQEN